MPTSNRVLMERDIARISTPSGTPPARSSSRWSGQREYGVEDEAGNTLVPPAVTTKRAIRGVAAERAGRLGASVYVFEVGEDPTDGAPIVVDREEVRAPSSRRTTGGRKSRAKPSLRIAYQIELTPDELRAVEHARGRYAWADMLAEHATEGGLVAFTEPEMWQWTDDVDSDAEGGHALFPMASSGFAEKLQGFYDEKI